MPGLIQNQLDEDLLKVKDAPEAGQVALAGSVGYEPVTREIDPAKETVSGQLDTVLGKDSPVLQRARAGAMQTANRRGLLNSTMAAEAGEAAVIDAALPIASADANVYSTAARENQSFKNQAQQFGASESNVSARLSADAMNQAARSKLAANLEASLIGTRVAGEKELTQLRGQIETQLQELRGGQAKMLADIEAGYRQLIQANSSASGFYSGIVKSIADVMADVNTSAEQKQNAVNTLSSLLQSGLTVIGGIANIDIAGLLDFTAPAEGAAA